MTEEFLFFQFNVFDPNTKLPVYTLFNFDIDKYKKFYNLNTINQYYTVLDFWKRLKCTFDQVYTLPDEYKQFFTPMTKEIIDYMNSYGFVRYGYTGFTLPDTFYTFDELLFSIQFKVEYFDDTKWRRLEDFFFEDEENFYSKYNFDFDKFSIDFNIYGSKILLFSNFAIRNLFLAEGFKNSSSRNIYESFKKYFFKIDKNTFYNYLFQYSVSSILPYSSKNIYNINYDTLFNLNTNIKNPNNLTPKEYYIQYGQYEQLILDFIPKPKNYIDLAKEKSCFLTDGNNSFSGFLYNSNDHLYAISCAHTLKDDVDFFYVYVVLQNFNYNLNEPESVTALFRIIAIDRQLDLFIAKYDPNLDFNIQKNINVSNYSGLNFYIDNNVSNGDPIFTISTSIHFHKPFFGYISDNNYNVFQPYRAPSLLLDCMLTDSSSGSPVFINDETNDLKLIGMIQSKSKNSNQYSIALNGLFMSTIVEQLIKNFDYYSSIYKKDIDLNNAIKFGYQNIWLGIINDDYIRLGPKCCSSCPACNSKELKNLNYTGGLIIEDFILGYDFVENKLITSSKDLNKSNIFVLHSPLLNTTLYNRFIQSNSVIVIKSISYFDNTYSSYVQRNFGQFSNQVPLSYFLYGLSPINTKINHDKYYNKISYEYPIISIEYFWYNGNTWSLDKEDVGGNTPDWYVEYDDNNGHLFYQHKFEFPSILLDFAKFFENHIEINEYTENLPNPPLPPTPSR
jgi:hypothetical protein